MKRLVLLLLAAVTLSGCVVLPYDAYYGGHRRYDDGYSRRSYWHGYDRYDRDYRYRSDRY